MRLQRKKLTELTTDDMETGTRRRPGRTVRKGEGKPKAYTVVPSPKDQDTGAVLNGEFRVVHGDVQVSPTR